MPILDWSGQLLTVCKCGFDTMAPVECTKWMTSTWECTLGHSCVYWASRLTKWTALVSMSSPWSFSGEFSTAVATSLPTPLPLPPARPPTPSIRWSKIGAHLQKNNLKWPNIKQVTNSNLRTYTILNSIYQ